MVNFRISSLVREYIFHNVGQEETTKIKMAEVTQTLQNKGLNEKNCKQKFT